MTMRDTAAAFMTVSLVVHAAGCEQRSGPGAVRVSESDSAGIALVEIFGSVEDLPLLTLSATAVTELSGDAPPFLVGNSAFRGLRDRMTPRR
jgi:hypothetical protein